MSRQRFIVVFVSILCLNLTASPTLADDADDIAAALQNFAARFDELASFGELGDVVPLTGLTPTGAEGLRLDELLGSTLGVSLENLSVPFDLSDVASAIAGASGVYLGVTIDFTNVTVEVDGGDSSLINVSFDVSASRNGVSLPISFADEVEPINFQDGGITVDFGLSTHLEFQLDTDELDPDLAFYLTAPPSVDVTVDASGSITGFTDLVGFVDVSVSGTAILNLDVGIDFVDPDDNGRITVDEWTNTAFADLVDVGFREEPGNEVEITLEMDTTLIPGSPDGTISLVDADLTDGLADPVVTLNALDDFTNISPSQILSGLISLTSSLGGAELFSDIELPYPISQLGRHVRFR